MLTLASSPGVPLLTRAMVTSDPEVRRLLLDSLKVIIHAEVVLDDLQKHINELKTYLYAETTERPMSQRKAN